MLTFALKGELESICVDLAAGNYISTYIVPYVYILCECTCIGQFWVGASQRLRTFFCAGIVGKGVARPTQIDYV